MADASTDKVVILARGLGKRMRQAAASAALDDRQAEMAAAGLKALIPVGRPFLDYVLSALADAGWRRVCLVVGPEHEALRDYYGRQQVLRRVSVSFAIQPEPKGTADAVAAAEAFVGDDEFLVINSDNYYPVEALGQLRQQPGSGLALFDAESMVARGNVSQERLRSFSVACLDGQGLLRRIVEKPDAATLASLGRPLWVSMNCWRFRPVIFGACRAIPPSPRGELELPTAVQYAIDVLGEPFRAIRLHEAVLDLTGREDIGPVAARLAHIPVEL